MLFSKGPRGPVIEAHELFLKRTPTLSATANGAAAAPNPAIGTPSVQYEKEFHKIRIFSLYEDPDGSGAFTSGIVPKVGRYRTCSGLGCTG